MQTAQELEITNRFSETPFHIAVIHAPKNQSEVIFRMSAVAIDKQIGKRWKDEEHDRIKIIARQLQPKRKPTDNFPKLIFQWTCESAGISHTDPKISNSRSHGRPPLYIQKKRVQYNNPVISYCQTRMCIMYLLTEYTKLTLKEIGEMAGGKHHSTVIHARDRVKEYLQIKDDLVIKIITRTIDKIEEYLNGI